MTPERLAEIERLQHEGPGPMRAAIADLLAERDERENRILRMESTLKTLSSKSLQAANLIYEALRGDSDNELLKLKLRDYNHTGDEAYAESFRRADAAIRAAGEGGA